LSVAESPEYYRLVLNIPVLDRICEVTVFEAAMGEISEISVYMIKSQLKT